MVPRTAITPSSSSVKEIFYSLLIKSKSMDPAFEKVGINIKSRNIRFKRFNSKKMKENKQELVALTAYIFDIPIDPS